MMYDLSLSCPYDKLSSQQSNGNLTLAHEGMPFQLEVGFPLDLKRIMISIFHAMNRKVQMTTESHSITKSYY